MHGALHLLGYDHDTPAAEAAMWAIQEAVLVCSATRDLSDRTYDEQSQLGGGGCASITAAPDGYLNGRWFSFKAALSGAAYTLRTTAQRSHRVAGRRGRGVGGMAAGDQPQASGPCSGLTMAMILALEASNTAVEAVVDLVSPEYHPLAKRAKDAAAGAMVFAVLGSLWVAIWIFGPRLWECLF